jgi:hypothetical protein
VAHETVDLHLLGQGSLGGAGAEGIAFGLPRAVVRAFEIGDDEVGLGGVGGDVEKQEKCNSEEIKRGNQTQRRKGTRRKGDGPRMNENKIATQMI